jgi:hypothetical protein
LPVKGAFAEVDLIGDIRASVAGLQLIRDATITLNKTAR